MTSDALTVGPPSRAVPTLARQDSAVVFQLRDAMCNSVHATHPPPAPGPEMSAVRASRGPANAFLTTSPFARGRIGYSLALYRDDADRPQTRCPRRWSPSPGAQARRPPRNGSRPPVCPAAQVPPSRPLRVRGGSFLTVRGRRRSGTGSHPTRRHYY